MTSPHRTGPHPGAGDGPITALGLIAVLRALRQAAPRPGPTSAEEPVLELDLSEGLDVTPRQPGVRGPGDRRAHGTGHRCSR